MGPRELSSDLTLGGTTLVEPLLQFLSRLEEGDLAEIDGDLGAGFWISPNPWFTDPDLEGAEPTNLDPVAAGEGLGHPVKDGVNDRIDVPVGQMRELLVETVNEIAFVHTQLLFNFLPLVNR